MKKKYKNINEEIDRIKKLFTEERLYGNLIIETSLSPIKSIFTTLDDIIDLLILNKKLDEAGADILKKRLTTNLKSITTSINSINTVDDIKNFLDPSDPNNITNLIIKNFIDTFKGIDKNFKLPYEGTKKTIYEIISKETDIIKDSYDTINSEILNKINEVIIKKSKLPDELTKQINEIYPTLGDKLKNLYNPVFHNVMDFIKNNLSILFKKIKTILSRIIQYITGIYNIKKQIVNKKFDKMQSLIIGVKWWAITTVIQNSYCQYIYTPEESTPINEQYTTPGYETGKLILSGVYSFLKFLFIPDFLCVNIKEAQEQAKQDVIEFGKTVGISEETTKNLMDNTSKEVGKMFKKTEEQINNATKPYSDAIQPYIDELSPSEKEETEKAIINAAKELE